jgi:hypothetical protein
VRGVEDRLESLALELGGNVQLVALGLDAPARAEQDGEDRARDGESARSIREERPAAWEESDEERGCGRAAPARDPEGTAASTASKRIGDVGARRETVR